MLIITALLLNLTGKEGLEHLEDDAYYHYPPDYIAQNFVDIHLATPRTIDFSIRSVP
jgi:hypothetical protein